MLIIASLVLCGAIHVVLDFCFAVAPSSARVSPPYSNKLLQATQVGRLLQLTLICPTTLVQFVFVHSNLITGASAAPTSREDLGAPGVSTTRDAEQEKFFNAICNATPGMWEEPESDERVSLSGSESTDSLREGDFCVAPLSSVHDRRPDTLKYVDATQTQNGHKSANLLVDTAGKFMLPFLNESAAKSSSERSSDALALAAPKFGHGHTLTPIDSDDEEDGVERTAVQPQRTPPPAADSPDVCDSVLSTPSSSFRRPVRVPARTTLNYAHSDLSHSAGRSRMVTRMASNAQQKIRRLGSAAVKRAITLPRAFERSNQMWPCNVRSACPCFPFLPSSCAVP